MVLEQNSAVEARSHENGRRAPWVKPELKRLDAGSAENAIDPGNDFAMNPS